MKLYSDLPARRTAQLVTDIVVFCWVAIWAWVGRVVHDAVMTLRQPADALSSAGRSFRESMAGAGDELSRLPLVGDGLRAPFDSAAASGSQLAQVGRDLGVAVERLALVLGLVSALTPILLVVVIWLLLRVRFVRQASAAQRVVAAGDGLDLFALRAMTRQPMHKLARISSDPAAAWRHGDQAVIRELARLELRSNGLRGPD